MKKTEVVASYREKYGWDMPNLKLARIIFEKEPLIFSSVENVRHILIKLEGKAKRKGGAKGGIRPRAIIPERPRNPYHLPQSHSEERLPLILPKSCNNVLVISDLHIPYHDVDAVTLAIKYGLENNVNTIFINGDLMDFHGLSRFEKDPRKRSVKQEFEATKGFLIALREAFPTQEIYWLKGNHCVRYEKWLMTKVYEVFDDEYYHLEQRLALNEQRIKLIDDNILVKLGKLAITHGHHIMRGFFAPVNSARGAWMKAKQSVLIGHVHKVSTHVEVNLDGHNYGCWSTGSLCELKPDYSPLASNYQHGFAHVLMQDDGDFVVKNMHIINGKIH